MSPFWAIGFVFHRHGLNLTHQKETITVVTAGSTLVRRKAYGTEPLRQQTKTEWYHGHCPNCEDPNCEDSVRSNALEIPHNKVTENPKTAV